MCPACSLGGNQVHRQRALCLRVASASEHDRNLVASDNRNDVVHQRRLPVAVGVRVDALLDAVTVLLQLEALCQQDGWTCAANSGLGFRWVSNDEIISTESEAFDSTDRSDIRVGLSFDCMIFRNYSAAAFYSLLERVGGSINCLSIHSLGVGRRAELLPTI